MAFPTLVSSTGSLVKSSNASSYTINFGFTADAGDLIVCAVVQDDPSGVTDFAWPGSWVQFFEKLATGGISVGAGYLVAAGGETSVVVSSGSGSDHWSALLWRFTGAGVPEAATAATGNSTTPNPPSHTPSGGSDDYFWIAGFACDNSGSPFPVTDDPDGYSNLIESNDDVTSGQAIRAGSRTNTASSEDPTTFTMGTETWTAFTFSIPPDGGAAEYDFTPSGFSVAVTFGTETLSLDTGVSPSGINPSVTFGTEAFDLETGVAPSGIAVPVTFGDIVVSENGFFPEGIAVPVTFGTVTLDVETGITPSGIPVSVTFGSAVLEDLDTGVTPSGIPVSVTFGSITTSLDFTFAASGIAVPVTFGTEALSLVTGYAPSGFAVSVNVGTFGASYAIVRITSITLHYPDRVETLDFSPRSAILHYAPSGWTVIMD